MLSGYKGYVFGIIGFVVVVILICLIKKEEE